MKIYTSLKSVPELTNLSSDERNRIWREYYIKSFGHWKTWVAIVSFIMFQLVIGELRYSLKELFPEIHRQYIDFPLLLFGWLMGCFIVFQVLVIVVRSYLAEERTD